MESSDIFRTSGRNGRGAIGETQGVIDMGDESIEGFDCGENEVVAGKQGALCNWEEELADVEDGLVDFRRAGRRSFPDTRVLEKWTWDRSAPAGCDIHVAMPVSGSLEGKGVGEGVFEVAARFEGEEIDEDFLEDLDGEGG